MGGCTALPVVRGCEFRISLDEVEAPQNPVLGRTVEEGLPYRSLPGRRVGVAHGSTVLLIDS